VVLERRGVRERLRGRRAVQEIGFVDDHHDRHSRPAERRRDEAIASAAPLGAIQHEQRAVAVGDLPLNAPLHALGERVAWLLKAGEIDQHELERVALALTVDDPADRPPGRLRLVRHGHNPRADECVHERRLAHVRPPSDGYEPGPHRSPWRIRAWSASISPRSVSWTYPAR